MTLNSYKQVTTHDNAVSFNSTYSDAYSNDSGINSLNAPSMQTQSSSATSKKHLFQNSNKNSLNTANGYEAANASSAAASSNNNFNICPKLDEVQIIEPLICKRIAKERLTSLVFKKDCFIVATQDGFINTWGRPSKVNKKNWLFLGSNLGRKESS